MLIWIGREVSDQVWTNLVTGGAAIVGAAVGSIGTLIATKRSLDYTRRKDNFQAGREALECRIKAVSALERTSDSYMRILAQDVPIGKPDEGFALFKPLVRETLDCVGATPWAFSEEIWRWLDAVRDCLGELEMKWDEMKPELEKPERRDEVRAEMDKAAQAFADTLLSVQVLAKQELHTLLTEYQVFMRRGI